MGINQNGNKYSQSIFAEFLDQSSIDMAEEWAGNVKEKMKKSSHKKIERTDDFVDFLGSVSLFFSLYVAIAEKFSEFPQDYTILKEYLTQRDLLFCENEETLSNLHTLMKNYYKVIQQRGSSKTFEVPDYDFSLPLNQIQEKDKELKSEFLRLICHKYYNDISILLLDPNTAGWNIGKSSPCYSGLQSVREAIKGYELEEIPQDISNYPIFTESGIDPSNIISIEDGVIKIDKSDPNFEIVGGIGVPTNLEDIDDLKKYAIPVNDFTDYEVSFRFKKQGNRGNFPQSAWENVSVGVLTLDKDFNPVSAIEPANTRIPSQISWFVQDHSLSQVDQQQEFFLFRGIIWNKDKFPVYDNQKTYKAGRVVFYNGEHYISTSFILENQIPGSNSNWQILPENRLIEFLKTSLCEGTNLIFGESAEFIIPILRVDLSEVGSGNYAPLYVYDFKVALLATSYSRGFVNTYNLIHFFFKNNNKSIEEKQIREDLRKKLIPYNSTFEFNTNLTQSRISTPLGLYLFQGSEVSLTLSSGTSVSIDSFVDLQSMDIDTQIDVQSPLPSFQGSEQTFETGEEACEWESEGESITLYHNGEEPCPQPEDTVFIDQWGEDPYLEGTGNWIYVLTCNQSILIGDGGEVEDVLQCEE